MLEHKICKGPPKGAEVSSRTIKVLTLVYHLARVYKFTNAEFIFFEKIHHLGGKDLDVG